MTREKDENMKKEYIIDYRTVATREKVFAELHEALKPFGVDYLQHIPYATVSLTVHQERDLVTTLAPFPGVTHRAAETRSCRSSLEERLEDV
jgi:hypothetical protein